MPIENNLSLQFDKIKRVVSSLPADSSCEVEVDSDFVERLLGRRQGEKLTRATHSRLVRIKDEIVASIEPRLTCELYSIASTENGRVSLRCGVEFKSRKMAHTLQGAPWLVCFVATIGPDLDRRIDELMQRGKVADAYVADAMGSGAIESVADQFHNDFSERLANLGQSVSLRFSPGYCDWSVAEQFKLFSLLDHEKIGVDLSDSHLMAPRKSISAVFGIFNRKAASITANDNPCRRCGKTDCIARRVEATPPSH